MSTAGIASNTLFLFSNTKTLDIGTNKLDQQGVDYLLEPLRRRRMTSLKRLYVPLNNIYGPGLLLITAAQTLGVFDQLEELDISDIGCSTDVIALFAKAIVDRYKGSCSQVYIGFWFPSFLMLTVSHVTDFIPIHVHFLNFSAYLVWQMMRSAAGKCALKRLKLFGVHPYAGKSARVMFPPEFLIRIRVS